MLIGFYCEDYYKNTLHNERSGLQPKQLPLIPLRAVLFSSTERGGNIDHKGDVFAKTSLPKDLIYTWKIILF